MAATVDSKLLRATKFPPEFNQKVDMQKVNIQVMKKWIASKISEILGSEDDVVTELCFGLVEGPRHPDIKAMQIQLTGFLEKDTPAFCKELWNLLLSAQGSPQGVPKELLEAKKMELIQEKMEAEKAAKEAQARREQQERRDRELADIRERERRDRGFHGGRGDNWRGARRGGDRAYNDRGGGYGRGRDRSFSPPRRGDRASRQLDMDRWVPQGRRGGRQDGRRGRSVTRSASADSSSRSRSRSNDSASPPRRRGPARRSPPRQRNARKRSRSRGRQDDHGPARDSRGRNTSSPSNAGDSDESRRRSPVRKRRRYSLSGSESRSRSPPRRGNRRRSRSYSSYSRSLSRSPRRRPARELIGRDQSRDRHGRLRRSSTLSRTRDGDEPATRRRSPSESPRPRKKPADVSEVEDRGHRPAPSAPAGSTTEENHTAQPTTAQQENKLREKLLKERIMKMRRSSTSGPIDGRG